MTAKSKFGFLLSVGGSLLSKDALSRRLQLPRRKKVLKAGCVTAEAPPKEKLATLGLVIQRIVGESRGERRAKQI